MICALVLETGTAVLLTWLTWRAASGSLARNGVAGVRTRVTMASDAAWRIGHRAALRPTIITGSLTVAWCVVAITVPSLRSPTSVLVAAGLLLGGTLLTIPAAHRAVRRALPES